MSESKMSQFDLEQSIMDCWRVTEDISNLHEAVLEYPDFDKDKISNVLIGLEQLYEIKFDKCFRKFEAFLADYYEMKNGLQAEMNSQKYYTEKRAPMEFEDDGFDDVVPRR